MKNKGFSLIEALVVLALITLIAGLGLCNLRSFYGLMVRADIEKLYTVCMYLQQKALSSQTKQVLRFDVGRKSYAYDDGTQQLNSRVCYGFIPGVQGPPSSPHAPIGKQLSFENDHIIFYADGTIQAGTVYLVDVNKKSLYALTSGVGHISFLRKYRYDGSWHVI